MTINHLLYRIMVDKQFHLLIKLTVPIDETTESDKKAKKKAKKALQKVQDNTKKCKNDYSHISHTHLIF